MSQRIQSYNQAFWKIVNYYDTENPNILRKIIHSFDVAQKCYSIACSLNLNENARNFCYLMGLMHDIGRFEQWKKYGTYDDTKSIDHGDLSYDMLCTFNCKDLFFLNDREIEVLKNSIKYHTKPYTGNDKDIKRYNEIINNADAFSNVITTITNEGIFSNFQASGVTKQILEDYLNQKLLIGLPATTTLDACLKQSACCYYVKFKFLREEILKHRYIDIIFEIFSKHLNPADKRTFASAINHLKKHYID